MVSQRNNTEKFLKKLGYSDKAIKGIHEMPFKTADQGKANAANDINNCQLCAPVLLARFRGVNITTITYKEGGFMECLANNMRLAFEKNDNITYYKFKAKCHNDTIKTKEYIRNKINELPNNSIFHFGYNKQINGEDGHIWTLIKSNDKLFIVDGQEKRGKNHSLESILPRIDYTQKVELLRVDNLNFSDEFINFFAYPHMRVE